MNLSKLIPVGLVASAGISFFSPISANADSIFVEGQILIAGAGSKEACEAKGKSWKPRDYRNYDGGKFYKVNNGNSTPNTISLHIWYCMGDAKGDPSNGNLEYLKGAKDTPSADYCSCQT